MLSSMMKTAPIAPTARPTHTMWSSVDVPRYMCATSEKTSCANTESTSTCSVSDDGTKRLIFWPTRVFDAARHAAPRAEMPQKTTRPQMPSRVKKMFDAPAKFSVIRRSRRELDDVPPRTTVVRPDGCTNSPSPSSPSTFVATGKPSAVSLSAVRKYSSPSNAARI